MTDNELDGIEVESIPEDGLDIAGLTIHAAYAIGGTELVLNVVFVRLLMARGYSEDDIKAEGNFDLEDVLKESEQIIRKDFLLNNLTSTH